MIRKFFLRGKVHGQGVILVDHRVAERVVLIRIFKYCGFHLRPFGNPKALGKRTRRDIAHDDFDRYNFNFFYSRFNIGQLLDKNGWVSRSFQGASSDGW